MLKKGLVGHLSKWEKVSSDKGTLEDFLSIGFYELWNILTLLLVHHSLRVNAAQKHESDLNDILLPILI